MSSRKLMAVAVGTVAVASVTAVAAMVSPDSITALVYGLGDAWSASVQKIPIGSNSIG